MFEGSSRLCYPFTLITAVFRPSLGSKMINRELAACYSLSVRVDYGPRDD